MQKTVHSGQKGVRDWQLANNKVTDLQNAVKTGTSGWKGRRTFHNLSPAEVNEKMRKGECFTCEEKYNPTHVCKNRQFRLMIMEEEEEGDPRSQQGEDKEEEMGEFHQLSLYF